MLLQSSFPTLRRLRRWKGCAGRAGAITIVGASAPARPHRGSRPEVRRPSDACGRSGDRAGRPRLVVTLPRDRRAHVRHRRRMVLHDDGGLRTRRRLIAHRDAVLSFGRPRRRLISPRPRLVPRVQRARRAELSQGRRRVAQGPQLLSEEPRLLSVAGELLSERPRLLSVTGAVLSERSELGSEAHQRPRLRR
jgi:hypothetical protein